MTSQAITKRMLRAINQLPEYKAAELSTFAESVIKQYAEQQLNRGVQKLVADSKLFGFLEQEEDLYSESDRKEVYHDKG